MTTIAHQRYSTKKFDPSKKITPQTLESILDAFRFSASMVNIQPWGCMVVSDQETKDILQGYSHNQIQVGSCSHLLVLCRRTVLDERRIDGVIEIMAQEHKVSKDSLKGIHGLQMDVLSSHEHSNRSSNQVHVALGQLLMTCSSLGVDACPIGLFNPQAYDDVLGLSDQSLASCVVLAIGYRSTDDKYVTLPKTRLPKKKVVFYDTSN